MISFDKFLALLPAFACFCLISFSMFLSVLPAFTYSNAIGNL